MARTGGEFAISWFSRIVFNVIRKVLFCGTVANKMGEESDPKCVVHCSGTFRVVLGSGRDVTPKSKLRCALLAVLACAPNMTVSRATLQDMFWGSSDEKRASGSLRTTIFQLRNEFAPIGAHAIQAHKHHVSLESDLWGLQRNDRDGMFLEGFDLRIKGAEEFEDWLRYERQSSDSYQEKSERIPVPVASNGKDETAYALGILAPDWQGTITADLAAVGVALDALIQAITGISLLTVYDLRGTCLKKGDLNLSGKNKRGFLLRTRLYQSSGESFVRFALFEARTGKVVRSFEPVHVPMDAADVEMAHLAERILETLAPLDDAVAPVDLLPWATLSSLFSLSPKALMSTESELNRLMIGGGPPVLRCLSIFLQIFKENEGLADHLKFEAFDLQNALASVSVSDPLRPLCESLVGYAAHMLCANNELSQFLLETAAQRSPNLALNLDHLAVVNLASGNLVAAKHAHERCMSVSSLSSWRYSYDITGAMIDLARGDFRGALRQSNQSLMQRPRFVGALRYAMISFALNKGEDNARWMRRRILQLRPDYDLSLWVENFLRRSDPVFGNNVALTLRDYELI